MIHRDKTSETSALVCAARTWSVRLHSCIVLNDEITGTVNKTALVAKKGEAFDRNRIAITLKSNW